MIYRLLIGLVAVILASQARAAGEPAPAPLPTSMNTDTLAGSLRGLLIRNMPTTLFETNSNWGRTTRVANGIKWKQDGGILLHPEVTHNDKNDGLWKRARVTAENLPDTLVVDIRNVQRPEPGRMTFDLFLSFDARFYYDQQRWDKGIRLADNSLRARFRVRFNLGCELITRLESNNTLLPDAVFRLRAVRADLKYDNFVVEHVAGIGGEGAKLLGDAASHWLREFHPALERDLLTKADNAIVKAGDTKEVRLSLSNFLGGSNPLAGQALDLLKGEKPR